MFWWDQKKIITKKDIPRIEGETQKKRKINFKKISINYSKKKIRLACIAMSFLMVVV